MIAELGWGFSDGFNVFARRPKAPTLIFALLPISPRNTHLKDTHKGYTSNRSAKAGGIPLYPQAYLAYIVGIQTLLAAQLTAT